MVLRTPIQSFLLILVLLGLEGAEGQESVGSTPTNLELYERNVQLIVDTLLSTIPTETDSEFAVKIQGPNHSWIVENAFLNALRSRDVHVRTVSGETVNSILFDFGVIELKVSYRKATRDEISGKRTIERSVSTVIAGKIYRPTTGELYYAGTVERISKDRIAPEDVTHVEHEQIGVTHGSLPSGGFMKKILEPAVVITATAIAVYLFFTVRS